MRKYIDKHDRVYMVDVVRRDCTYDDDPALYLVDYVVTMPDGVVRHAAYSDPAYIVQYLKMLCGDHHIRRIV